MAITNQKLIEESLGIAVSTGADFAEVYWELTRNGNITLLGGKIDAIADNTVSGVGIRAFLGTRTVYGSTSDLSREGLIKCARSVAEAMGEAQGDPCIMNVWVHDGSKDLTVNRMLYRELLKDSLDQIFATEYKNMKDCIESKVFGIGLESYTVGSNDFYIGYGASRGKMVTLDTGHFHPTESIADKISSLLLYTPEVMLHVSRPVRWDSDHVTIINDETLELCKEITRCNALDKVHIGLDYFDASINRIGAYVIGSRATQKCVLQALLEPIETLRAYELSGKGFERLALLEECKSLPWNAVWDMFCLKNDVPVGEEFIADVQKYEQEVTSKRN